MRRFSSISLVFFMLVFAGIVPGCTAQGPVPIGNLPFQERAVAQTDGDLSVKIAALGPNESEGIFGADLARRGIQPVWIMIENAGDGPYWLFPIRTDPNYYSPAEAAHMTRSLLFPSRNRMARLLLEKLELPNFVPPRGLVSGFIYTNIDPGLKYVNVSLLGLNGMKNFRTVADVPGIKADYQEADLGSLYLPDELIECDEARLRAELEKMPCCTTNSSGTGNGDPLNLVFIGDVDALITALVGGGWNVTERLSPGALWRTIRSYLFGKEYRHAPVSSLYVFGRRQDAAFQKARGTVAERNHLRVWLTPLRLKGLPVWIGQISRDIGVKLTLTAGFPVTHIIDPDLDNDRYYLVQNVADTRALMRLGYVKGAGEAPPNDPRYNLSGDPYFTDGLRAVMFCSGTPVPLSQISFFNWEFTADIEPYRRNLSNMEADNAGEHRF